MYIEWLKVTLDAGTYYIRVQALDDGATGYYLRFGLAPAPNSAPVFGSESYGFSVPEDAAVGAVVGSVSATDADGDTMAYTITAGDEEGRFAVDPASGAVTVAAALDHETGPSYELTVHAGDGNGAATAAVVAVAVTDVDEDPPDPGAPLAAVDLAAAATHRSVKVSWTLPAQPEGVYVGDMYLERLDAEDTVVRSIWVAEDLVKDEASDWSDRDSALDAATVYRYRVRLVVQQPGGWSDVYSQVLEVATQADAPAVPQGPSAVVEGSEVALSWTVPQQPPWLDDAANMQLSRGRGHYFAGLPVAWQTWNRGTTAYSHTDTVPWTGHTYKYRVRMFAGAAGALNGDIIEVPVPAAAATPTAQAAHDQVELSWTVPEPHQWGPVDAIEVLRDDIVVAALAWQPGTAAYSHTDTGVAPETAYRYRLRMVSDNVTINNPAITATTEAAPEPDPEPVSAGLLSAFERLTGGDNSAVRTGTTADGVRYVQFLRAAPEPQQPHDSATGGWSPGYGAVTLMDDSTPKAATTAWAGAAAGGWTLGGATAATDPVSLDFIQPHGLWSDGTTLWVSARKSSSDDSEKLYAYVLDGGARDAGKDIELDLPDMPAPGDADLHGNKVSGLWMDGDTVWASVSRLDQVLAFHRNDDTADPSQHSAGGRKPGEDFSNLVRTRERTNDTPMGLWSDGTNMWVADYGRGSGLGGVFVYDLGTKAPVTESCGRYFSAGGYPVGAWSDGISTMWLSDAHADKIFAYRLSDCGRDKRLDLNGLSAENIKQIGLWSDNEELWVADRDSNKVFVYDLPGGDARLVSLTATATNLKGFTPEITDYSRNLVGNVTQVTVEAVTIRDDASFVIAPADANTGTDGHQVNLTTGETTTVTVSVKHRTDSRTYTLKLTPLKDTTGTLSDDATLSALTLSGVTLDPSFDADVTEYRYQLTHAQITSGLTTTVEATANDSDATVSIKPDDADDADDHQVATADGKATVEVTVTAQDGSDRTYTVQIMTVSRDESKDITLAEDPWPPFDIWADGQTMWLITGSQLMAYDMDTGNRVPGKDHNTRNLANQYFNLGVWSNGDTKWLSMIGDEVGENIVYGIDAQTYGTAALVAGESFYTKAAGARFVRDLWSDGETIWVAPVRAWDWTYTDLGLDGGELLAYDFKTKARKAGKDIAIATTGYFVRIYDRNMSFAVWSDGTLLWVVSNYGDHRSKLEAHKLSDGSRVPSMDIRTGEDGITDPRGMWSDGRTMWVLDAGWQTEPELRRDIGVHAYALAPNAKLYSLEMSGADFGHFIHGLPKYSASVANDVTETTLTWEQAFTGGSAGVAVKAVNDDGTSTTDADSKTGYQVDLAEGTNTITITVTAPNGTDTYAYTVTITRASE